MAGIAQILSTRTRRPRQKSPPTAVARPKHKTPQTDRISAKSSSQVQELLKHSARPIDRSQYHVAPGFFRQNADDLFFELTRNKDLSFGERALANAAWQFSAAGAVVEDFLRMLGNVPNSVTIVSQFADRAQVRATAARKMLQEAKLPQTSHGRRLELTLASVTLLEKTISDINQAGATFALGVALPVVSVLGPLRHGLAAARRQLQSRVAASSKPSNPAPPVATAAVGASSSRTALSVPQGVTEKQFSEVSALVRREVANISDDVAVHGSRSAGTARPNSDIDIAIRVSSEKFDAIIQARFGTPNPGSARERTMLHAIQTGKIQTGEAGLRRLRNLVRDKLGGMKTDLSIIRKGGQFDRGPYIKLKVPNG